MKKNLFKSMFIAATALAFSSCSQDLTNDAPFDGGYNGATKIIKLTADIAETRTELDGHTLQWKDEDTFGLLTSADGSTILQNIKVDYAKANSKAVEIAVAENAKYIYGYYPYNAELEIASATLGNFTLSVPDQYAYGASEGAYEPSIDGIFPMLAAKTALPEESDNADVVISFKAADACLVEFNIYGGSSADEQLVSLDLFAEKTGDSVVNSKCFGDMKYDLTGDEPVWDSEFASGDGLVITFSWANNLSPKLNGDKSAAVKAYGVIHKGIYTNNGEEGEYYSPKLTVTTSENIYVCNFESLDCSADGATVNINLANSKVEHPLENSIAKFVKNGLMLDIDTKATTIPTNTGSYTYREMYRYADVSIDLAADEISSVTAVLTTADDTKSFEVSQPGEVEDDELWDGTVRVSLDGYETLAGTLKVTVLTTDGHRYIATRAIDTTPLVEFADFDGGSKVYAPNTYSAEVKLQFAEGGLDKIKRLAIGAVSATGVSTPYYADAQFAYDAPTSFAAYDKGTSLDSYVTIPYRVFDSAELGSLLAGDGTLHLDEDDILFNAHMIDGEYVPGMAIAFSGSGKYMIAAYVEYADGGYGVISTTWTAPTEVFDGTVTPVFTKTPSFDGLTATAEVTAEGAAKLATFIYTDQNEAFPNGKLNLFCNTYENRFHKYNGTKTMEYTADRIGTYKFIAVAIDANGRLSQPVTCDATYDIQFDTSSKITEITLEQQTVLDWLNFSIKAENASEVRVLAYDYGTGAYGARTSSWFEKDDRGARALSADKIQDYFTDPSLTLGNKLVKQGDGSWKTRYENGLALSSIETKGGIEIDTSGSTDVEIEIPATGGGKFYIFFTTVTEGSNGTQFGHVYLLRGNYANYELVDLTEAGYNMLESIDNFYTTALPDELAEAGGGDVEEEIPLFTNGFCTVTVSSSNTALWLYAAATQLAPNARGWWFDLGTDGDDATIKATLDEAFANYKETKEVVQVSALKHTLNPFPNTAGNGGTFTYTTTEWLSDLAEGNSAAGKYYIVVVERAVDESDKYDDQAPLYADKVSLSHNGTKYVFSKSQIKGLWN